MTYQDALDYLNNFVNYEKVPMPPASAGAFNLERVRQFLSLLGEPQMRYRSIVVAGTKGKGSTAALMANALQAGGARVGLYAQPHLHTYRERMRVNGELISRAELAGLVEKMRPAVEKMLAETARWGTITGYEIGTGLALLFFAEQGVAVAVLEVGLGGRLDAVNVVTPQVSVITSLSLDHMAVLGDTIEAIAAEKAGIIKPGVPLLTVAQWPPAQAVLEEFCRERGAPLTVVPPARLQSRIPTLSREHRRHLAQPLAVDFGPHCIELDLPLLGAHQRLNAALAAAALWQFEPSLSPQALAAGFAATVWPARLELLLDQPGHPLIVADGAHNAESVARLREALQEHFWFEKLWLVVGIYSDKDIGGIFREIALAPSLAGLVLTRSRNPRAADPSALAKIAASIGEGEPKLWRIELSSTVEEGIKMARQLAGPLDLICITGSLSVAAESAEVLNPSSLARPG